MRGLTNIVLFLAVILAVVAVYTLRQQTFGGFQKQFGAVVGKAQSAPVVQKPLVARKTTRPSRSRTATPGDTVIPQVEILTEVISVSPKPPLDSIQVGMEKASLGDFGQPDVVTSSREGDFFETYIYLANPAKATVVRLVNGRVSWIGNSIVESNSARSPDQLN